MPQFDFYCFSVQVFYTLSGFFVFYFFCLNNIILKIGELFKIRAKLLLNTTSHKSIIKFYSSCFY